MNGGCAHQSVRKEEKFGFPWGKTRNRTKVAQLGKCTEIAAFNVNLMYFGWSVHTLYCTKESFDKIYPKPKSVFTYRSTSFVQ